MDAKREDKFDKRQAAERMEAALRGAFKTPPTPMKSIAPKRAKQKAKKASVKR
jgi:hypothetical protein